jgi:hypothetical protein
MKQYSTRPARTFEGRHLMDEWANLGALILFLDGAPKPKALYDIFGGQGFWAQELSRRWPKVPLYSFDLDEECCALICARAPTAKVACGDSLSIVPERGAGVLFDFNLMTLARREGPYGAALLRAFRAGARWVIWGDAACGKLHLNFRTYGLSKPDPEEYRQRWRAYAALQGYRVKRIIQPHPRNEYYYAEEVR